MTFPAGYDTDKGQDPAEDHIGPFYYRLLDGEYEFAFLAGPEHANASNTLHGGVMMTFADYSLCMVATDGYENESCVTVSFSSEFIAAAEVGQVITCKAEVVRKTGSMVFVRGDVRAGEQILLNFSSVVKRMQPRD